MPPLDIRDDSEPLDRTEFRAWAPEFPRLQVRAEDDPWKDEPPPDRALNERFDDDEPLWNEPREEWPEERPIDEEWPEEKLLDEERPMDAEPRLLDEPREYPPPPR